MTDEFGETGTTTQTLTIGADTALSTSFSPSPSPATIGANVIGDAPASTPNAGRPIVRYDWNFGETNEIHNCRGDAECGTQNKTL